MLALPGVAAAATYSVTNGAATGAGSLAQAIADSNSSVEGDVIQIAPGASRITLTAPLPAIAGRVRIIGLVGPSIARTSEQFFPIFVISAGADVKLARVNVGGPFPGASDGVQRGAGIVNHGKLEVQDCALWNLQVTGNLAEGGAIYNAGQLTLTNVRLQSNSALSLDGSARGGAICNTGTLIINGGRISDNFASATALGSQAIGGAIFNTGSVMISEATIKYNSARGVYGEAADGSGDARGGAIANESDGTVMILRSLLRHNAVRTHLTGQGGAIWSAGGNMNIFSSTLSENGWLDRTIVPALASGGAVAHSSTSRLRLINCTIFKNGAGRSGELPRTIWQRHRELQPTPVPGLPVSHGGGVARLAGRIDVSNTIVARNKAGDAPDLFGDFVSNGHNLIGVGSGAAGLVSGEDMAGTPLSPQPGGLTAYGDIGGPTGGHNLQDASMARQGGDNRSIDALPGLTEDQRKLPRLLGGTVDIGAVESALTQPDLEVAPPGGTNFIGRGIFPLVDNQIVSFDAFPGQPVAFLIRIRKAGEVGDYFSLSATTSAHLSAYLDFGDHQESLGTGGALRLPLLAPGEERVFEIKASIFATALVSSTQFLQIAASSSYHPKTDQVAASVTVKSDPRDWHGYSGSFSNSLGGVIRTGGSNLPQVRIVWRHNEFDD